MRFRKLVALATGVVCCCFSALQSTAQARTAPAYAAWLAYRRVTASRVFPGGVPDTIVVLGDDILEQSAARELTAGWRGMLGREPRIQNGGSGPSTPHVVLGTTAEMRLAGLTANQNGTLAPDSFRLLSTGQRLVVEAGDARGVLYGAFALLRLIAEEQPLSSLDQSSGPADEVRWTNEWDNTNGSIERGYAGPSIFFEAGSVRGDLSLAAAYARLLSSVGINGCTINNVNADVSLLKPDRLRDLARIADVFRPYGVRLSLAVDMSSPVVLGHLQTFDPLDGAVAAWWKSKMDGVYRVIPDFGGVVIKADSEGRAGPSQYGRTPADAANVVARALAPHGGVVLYRGFVYNHHLDWTDPKADRARAGYDNFHELDGKFEPNVIVQIKHGPIDFQVREPVSPLFAALPHTNEAIELQITQEYTGQQRHLVYLVPMWKEALDTDMRASTSNPHLFVKDLVSGHSIGPERHTTGGFVGVANVGTERWLGHPLALANLYGFGRLAWDPNLSSEAISDEWTRLTFGNDPDIRRVVDKLELDSWHIYESYTGPLGVGTLTDIIGVHFGPGIESAERNGWGQWIRADHQGVGMDRTVATGTGYIGQYPAPLARKYESLATCPDELLLFMHHVPYTYRLHSGKTVIQHIYDSHYWGADAAAAQVPAWESLRGKIPDAIYDETLKRLQFQAGHAVVWRDAVTRWFARMSGIADAAGRVGTYPGRIEAESMTLNGYASTEVTPWETASAGRAVICRLPECSAETTWDGRNGWYDFTVQYFDLKDGASRFSLAVGSHDVETWTADDTLPSDKLNGHTSTRRVITGVALHHGDVIRVTGQPNGPEQAPLDYIEIHEHQPRSGAELARGAE